MEQEERGKHKWMEGRVGWGHLTEENCLLIMKKKDDQENRVVLIWSLLKFAFKWIQGGLMKAGELTSNWTLHLSLNAFNGLVVGTLFSLPSSTTYYLFTSQITATIFLLNNQNKLLSTLIKDSITIFFKLGFNSKSWWTPLQFWWNFNCFTSKI